MLNHNPMYELENSDLLLVVETTTSDYSTWHRLYDLHDREYGLIIWLSKDDEMNEKDRILLILDTLFDWNHPQPSKQESIIKKIDALLEKRHKNNNSAVSITL